MSAQGQPLPTAPVTLETPAGKVGYYPLNAVPGAGDLSRLPYTIRILAEAALRNIDGVAITAEHLQTILGFGETLGKTDTAVPFMPARVILQDFTGVPAVVDIASMRDAYKRLGGDPAQINPQVPVDLVIDHSVQVDYFASPEALEKNAEREFERNRERYEFLHWAQQSVDNFRVVPPASGIVHQVNLEYIAKVVATKTTADGAVMAFPDTLVGTDSHTTMINGLGVLGWGVGGIEAEAVMLGQPVFMPLPEVIGVRLAGRLPEGVTATDLVLTVTQMLRKHGVVGKFVEFTGPGLAQMSLADRATIANMAPEYGATCGFFPVDDETLNYLRRTGRDDGNIALVEAYMKAQGLFWSADTPEPTFTDLLELDLGSIVPSLAGPKRPQDRVELPAVSAEYGTIESAYRGETKDAAGDAGVSVTFDGETFALKHGAIVIAAITSCTNTSNPSVLLAAGILAKKAVEKGLVRKPWVKTSLAPGSRVVTKYLEKAGLLPYLEQLGFHVVGYGCTTCIGNSGPLPEPIAEGVVGGKLMVGSVLSGNRNFEGRVNPHTRVNYLASPPLVVAYALAGSMHADLANGTLATAQDGTPVTLRDIWPTNDEIAEALAACITPEMFKEEYGGIYESNETWNRIQGQTAELYPWEEDSTYVQAPPFFDSLTPSVPPIAPIRHARVLAVLGDSITTDHISPAGAIPADSAAGKWLQQNGVMPREFNSYGSRRGNHEVMMRGTFANIRLRNKLAPGTEGGYTTHLPTDAVTSIYDAAMRYQESDTPLIVLAGKEYGTGSSRDWAAKGAQLLGVKAVIAESYERIHRSNLVFMGVLPLQFLPGESIESLGLTGHEEYCCELPEAMQPGARIHVTATDTDGTQRNFEVIARVDTPIEVIYYRNGGILNTVLRDFHAKATT